MVQVLSTLWLVVAVFNAFGEEPARDPQAARLCRLESHYTIGGTEISSGMLINPSTMLLLDSSVSRLGRLRALDVFCPGGESALRFDTKELHILRARKWVDELLSDHILTRFWPWQLRAGKWLGHPDAALVHFPRPIAPTELPDLQIGPHEQSLFDIIDMDLHGSAPVTFRYFSYGTPHKEELRWPTAVHLEVDRGAEMSGDSLGFRTNEPRAVPLSGDEGGMVLAQVGGRDHLLGLVETFDGDGIDTVLITGATKFDKRPLREILECQVFAPRPAVHEK